MNELTIQRTPEMIAGEINMIKAQARDTYVRSAIEIGRRLYEAKAMVAYGKWGEWLEMNVEYSVRTAQNLIAVYEEYGRNGDSQAIAGLNFTQAVLLLGLDGETRSELLESGKVPEMSTRELKAEIERLNDEIEKRQVTMDQVMKEAEVQKELDDERAVTRDLRTQLDAAKAEAAIARKNMSDAVDRANKTAGENTRLKAELDAERAKAEPEPVITQVEVVPEEIQRELDMLRKQAESHPCAEVIVLRRGYSEMVEKFREIEGMLGDLEEKQPDEAAKYRAAVAKAAAQMAERLTKR